MSTENCKSLRSAKTLLYAAISRGNVKQAVTCARDVTAVLKNVPIIGIITLGVALILCGNIAHAETVFTDQTTFVSQLQPSYYLETFNSLPTFGSVTNPTTFSQNGFSFTASTTSGVGLFGVTPDAGAQNDVALSTDTTAAPITIDFLSGNVTAVGGQFFPDLVDGSETPGSVTVTLNDGSSQTITATTANPQPFLGFTSNSPILSLTEYLPTNSSNYTTINNLYVGSAVPSVPEPSSAITFVVASLALLGLTLRARRSSVSTAR